MVLRPSLSFSVAITVSPRGQVSDGIDNMGTHRRPRLLGIDFPVHVAVAKGGVHGGARPAGDNAAQTPLTDAARCTTF